MAEISTMVVQIAEAAERQNKAVLGMPATYRKLLYKAVAAQQADTADENLAEMTDDLRRVMGLFKTQEDEARTG